MKWQIPNLQIEGDPWRYVDDQGKVVDTITFEFSSAHYVNRDRRVKERYFDDAKKYVEKLAAGEALHTEQPFELQFGDPNPTQRGKRK